MRTPVSGIAVIIPVRDEEELLPGALAAIDVARVQLREIFGDNAPWVRVIIVLDSCTDGSTLIAGSWADVETIIVAHHAVGAARREGIRHFFETFEMAAATAWIANTDADSQVPSNWLCTQWEFATAGVDLMVGTVRPDFADLSEAQRLRWLATHVPGEANGHVHGANLGFRADRYLEVGGFQPVREHEDVLLVAALKERRVREVATDSCCVLTSGRNYGRTPGGYASHLRERLCADSVNS